MEKLKTVKKYYGFKPKTLMYELSVDSNGFIKNGKLYGISGENSIDVFKILKPKTSLKTVQKDNPLEYVIYMTYWPIYLMELTKDVTTKKLKETLLAIGSKNKNINKLVFKYRNFFNEINSNG